MTNIVSEDDIAKLMKAFQRFDTGQFLKFGTKLTFEKFEIFHYFSTIERTV